jgi:hypothetical protein
MIKMVLAGLLTSTETSSAQEMNVPGLKTARPQTVPVVCCSEVEDHPVHLPPRLHRMTAARSLPLCNFASTSACAQDGCVKGPSSSNTASSISFSHCRSCADSALAAASASSEPLAGRSSGRFTAWDKTGILSWSVSRIFAANSSIYGDVSVSILTDKRQDPTHASYTHHLADRPSPESRCAKYHCRGDP